MCIVYIGTLLEATCALLRRSIKKDAFARETDRLGGIKKREMGVLTCGAFRDRENHFTNEI